MLAVLAHPDDESFGSGGLLAKYSAEGVRVALVCATRGEAGEISDPSLATPEELPQVREREACAILGVEDRRFLGYRDSGMAGAPDNQHVDALCQADFHEVAGTVVKIIREIRPQVLITFDPRGGYGHPDHVFMHRAAREAFSAAGDSSRYGEQLSDGLEPYAPSKLYYVAFPSSMVRAFQEMMKAAGVESSFTEIDPETLGIPDKDITTVVDVGGYSDQKRRAILCHRTQIQEYQFWDRMPESVRARFLSHEYFVRAEPPFLLGHDVRPGHDVGEDDLFGDVPD